MDTYKKIIFILLLKLYYINYTIMYNKVIQKTGIRFYSTPIFHNFRKQITCNNEKIKNQIKEFKDEPKHKSFDSYKNMYSCLPIYIKLNK